MLEKINPIPELSKEEYLIQCSKAKERLAALQLQIQQQELPVILLIEGLSASGKGSTLSKIVLAFDPRFVKSYSIAPPTSEEARYHPMKRFWEKIPAKGNITVLDRSWYRQLLYHSPEKTLTTTDFLNRLEEIQMMERELTDNGYLIIKLFLHIDKEEQYRRLSHLGKKEATRWKVTECDWKQNKKWNRIQTAVDYMLEQSHFSFAPWEIINATNKKSTTLSIYRILISNIERALQSPPHAPVVFLPHVFNGTETLRNFSAKQNIPVDEYHKKIKKNQKKLLKLQNQLYRYQIPAIILFEGFDAAGKGGAIKRVAAALDGRGYQINPISAPTKEEAERHYLWRFYRTIPKQGHIAIYDRSWYGRVLVERVEHFCSVSDWQRAYWEINEFEKSLTDWGAILIKFFLQIDPDEQLKRFQNRENTPLKRHKITEEDWRNRGKRSQYETAVVEMLRYTSSPYAPWKVVNGNDKLSCRLEIISHIIHTLSNSISNTQ